MTPLFLLGCMGILTQIGGVGQKIQFVEKVLSPGVFVAHSPHPYIGKTTLPSEKSLK